MQIDGRSAFIREIMRAKTVAEPLPLTLINPFKKNRMNRLQGFPIRFDKRLGNSSGILRSQDSEDHIHICDIGTFPPVLFPFSLRDILLHSATPSLMTESSKPHDLERL
jgi:hypothetical protein